MESALVIPFARPANRPAPPLPTASPCVEDWIRDERRAAGDEPDALAALGGVLNALCRFAEAEEVLRLAVVFDPGCVAGWSNLGNVMVERQRFPDAVACFCRALAVQPCHGPTLSNLGVALTACGALADALRFLDLAVACQPDNAESRSNRALALLAAGRWREGFAEYEWRWRTRSKPKLPYPEPRWNGEAFAGRTILLHEEGGFGDTLQLLRYLPMVKARGGTVLLRVRAPLVRLASRAAGVDRVLSWDAPLPAFDVQCPLFSLPHLFDTEPDSVPGAGGYLLPPRAETAIWHRRLDDAMPATGPRPPRVGLVWAGGPHPYARESALADRRRSMTLRALAPLAAARPDAVFFSLQQGEAAVQAAEPPAGMRLVDHAAELRDFDDTAALVAQLDLVVSVDTAVAHLAAAMGKPVWLLSRFDGCWRWLSDRDDSPWYDSVRLFRQPAPFDWEQPVMRMAAALREFK